MDLNRILEKQRLYSQRKGQIDAVTLSSYEKDFELTFTYDSTAIEGNTLTLMETKAILEMFDSFTDLEEEQLDTYLHLIKK